MLKWRAFLWIWGGQVVSILGSNLSGFALGVWLYQTTGSASNFALVALCTVLPQLMVSPLAGGLVDRYPRRWMMALGDSGAAVCTLVMAALFFSGHIQPWMIFLTTALSSACGALQAPAYVALVAGVMRDDQLGRANGLLSLGQGLAEILAPGIAGVLVVTIGVPGVLLIDLATFGVAVTALALVRVPERHLEGQPAGAEQAENTSYSHLSAGHHPAEPKGHRAAHGGLLATLSADLRAGWEALRAQPGLVGLLRFQMVFSFLWSLFAVLVSPMLLGFSDAQGLGVALTLAGGGMLAGSLVMSAWGGPQRRLLGLLGFELVSAVGFVLMGLRPNLALVAGAAFLAHFSLAFVSGLNQSIWQSRVAPAVLGRVLALRQVAVKASTLLAYLMAGGLADRVLAPMLSVNGALAGSLGTWIGVGAGRGIAALLVLIGLAKAITVLAVYFSPGAREMNSAALPVDQTLKVSENL
jgi:DHA3 family macrolide efflux protein-like MFS transporter